MSCVRAPFDTEADIDQAIREYLDWEAAGRRRFERTPRAMAQHALNGAKISATGEFLLFSAMRHWLTYEASGEDVRKVAAGCMSRHPNLSDQINDNIEQSERDGGLHLDGIRTAAIVRTQNNTYTLRRVGHFEPAQADNLFTIQGGTRFPEPVACRVNGSTWGGFMLKARFLGIGMHMEIVMLDGSYSVITMSRIQSVEATP